MISLLGGMIVGSALAMLLTPQSGPELRTKIKEWAEEEVEKLQQQIKSQIEEARCHCESKEA